VERHVLRGVGFSSDPFFFPGGTFSDAKRKSFKRKSANPCKAQFWTSARRGNLRQERNLLIVGNILARRGAAEGNF